jgi:hypothetical protein
MRHPQAQLRANHRPAGLIPPGIHPGQVVVVQAPAPSVAGRILLTLAVTVCSASVIVLLALALRVVTVAATAALPTLGGAGVTVKIARSK